MLRRSAVAFSLAALFASTLLSGILALSSPGCVQNPLCCCLQTTQADVVLDHCHSYLIHRHAQSSAAPASRSLLRLLYEAIRRGYSHFDYILA